MDIPVPNIQRRHMDNPSAGVSTSPQALSTSSPQNMNPGPPHPFTVAPSGRAQGLPAPLPHMEIRSPGAYNVSPFSHSFNTTSPSPSTSASLQETQAGIPSVLSAPGLSPTQISQSSLNAQKRAYRQRRKDPSCDACRERKVKCDATETTACSECSSRNHKCQFTKETNRRMSSIKQVQDLQTRIADLTEENVQLRARISGPVPPEPTHGSIMSQHPESQMLPPNVSRRSPPPAMKNLEHVRRNVRKYSAGIFDSPFATQNESVPMNHLPALPDIPPRPVFAQLSRAYLHSIHEFFPVLHWPTFQQEVDEVYASRSFQDRSQEWVGLFFAVMACGSLHTSRSPNGSPRVADRSSLFFEIATQAIDPHQQNASITRTTLAFLLSIFATESNMKSVGAVWLAAAVRLAQLLRIYSEIDAPVLEAEIRRRLWWSLYTLDRFSSLSGNLPMLINEDDCNIAFPSALDDRYIQPHGFTRQPTDQPPVTGLLATIHTARLFSHLRMALKPLAISPQIFQSMEIRFRATWAMFPESYQLHSQASLEAAALAPLLALQTARFLLHRRNISPLCAHSERIDALHRCNAVAQETANYIRRTLRTASGTVDPEAWHTKATQLASNMISLHLWRCILMLCFCGDYDLALICVHFSSAIGDTRRINTACGKNLAFFLDRLLDRIRSGNGGRRQLEYDEEMLVYTTGDLQGDGQHAWVWAGGSDTSGGPSPLSPLAPSTHTRHGSDGFMLGIKMESQSHSQLPLRPNPGSPSQNGTEEWAGWASIEHMILQLVEERRIRLAQPTPYYPPPHNPMKRVQLAPDAPPSPTRTGALPPVVSSSSSSSTSRISIANII